jgi:hypothetical protein
MIAMRQTGLPRFRQLAPKALQILALVLQAKATPFKIANCRYLGCRMGDRALPKQLFWRIP